MQQTLQITFRGFPHSDAVEAEVRDKAAKLEQFYPRITGCRVVVEAEHHHHHQGNLYHVRIDLRIPGRHIVVRREHHDNHAREDVYVVIRDAFDAARRRLEEHARQRRGVVKRHAPAPRGTVARLEGDHGYIQLADGREVYFHHNSLANGAFGQLSVGTAVKVSITEDKDSARATAVRLIARA